jgi:hypothetical protein
LFISDLRAVLTYLEANREEIVATSSRPWPFGRRMKTAINEPLDAEFTEVGERSPKESASKRRAQNVRLLKD